MTSTFIATLTATFHLLSPLAAAALLLAPCTAAQAAAAPAPAPPLTGSAEAGKAAFRKCASCHQVGPSARGGFGPKLTGVIGRKAGSTTDYKYSAAMKNANIVWTEQNLARFLAAPSDFIPGNNMRFWGIGNTQQVADLLAYLRTQ
ncbi:c-type cytochrome [Janthinobacterium violaceinigrum]|uniref:C-type cytochrome n=1 Tax=Janthinobacterium violaceinigrum TaxID=2654252 RepID=A0A6I1IR47_9BURK|nr:cytochrome c family protein [Janthinobacterium violaceinigrum]KAB8066721.1 c-type cytochrome [Janthinobacterium violaceinigrum]